ncbi:hypothetical protein PV08_10667 [Exophiala spinifera]|uniref:YDG domain-containing protein n=1 Tax=Exophiala spinifera TaxID=91928 RepID=A0A0D1ZEE6_9EURO|nr:uncharacterized protein PV08_10667 [Exophiala spinifera]KIW11367.1 hypothetical protein PV08_10667 [Exophiala spinifera]
MPFSGSYVSPLPRYSWVSSIGRVPIRPQRRRHHDIYRPQYSRTDPTEDAQSHRDEPQQPRVLGPERPMADLDQHPRTGTAVDHPSDSLDRGSTENENRSYSSAVDQQTLLGVEEITVKREESHKAVDGEYSPCSETNERSRILEDKPEARISDNTDHGTTTATISTQPAPPSSPHMASREEKVCYCPISEKCPARASNLHDCRQLVLEWKKWEKREENKRPVLPLDRDTENEVFVTLDEAIVINKLLEQVNTRSRLSMRLRYTFDKIRDWIRKMAHNSISREVLDQGDLLRHLKKFLGEDNEALREIKKVPVDIVEDLTSLYRKWELGDLSVLPRRGLLRSAERAPWTVDPQYPYQRSANFYGHGHLVNGQTWICRAAMRRDGAHSALQAGICGTVKDGARSIVMGYYIEDTKEGYADRDFGETIEYIGTARRRQPDDEEPTNVKDPAKYRSSRKTKNTAGEGPTCATECLMTSFRTGKPVRVFRSYKLPPINSLRPLKGFRYDGLYVVKKYELLKKERQIYKFIMTRMKEGQGPLRDVMPPFEPVKKKRAREPSTSSSGRQKKRKQ